MSTFSPHEEPLSWLDHEIYEHTTNSPSFTTALANAQPPRERWREGQERRQSQK